jgi:hypothetical protein
MNRFINCSRLILQGPRRLAPALSSMFTGSVEKSIRCLCIQHESKCVEVSNPYQLSLVVKGCSGLKESLQLYCQPEQLTGSNQYRVPDHGLQDVAKQLSYVRTSPDT